MSGRFAALEIDRRRVFEYDSIYFDTPDLFTFRQHVQGRRRRYKVAHPRVPRHRRLHVRDQAARSPQPDGQGADAHPIADRYTLTPPARAFLVDHLWAAHALVPPLPGPVVSTAYRRAMLVDLEAAARVTLDVEFVCAGGEGRGGGLHTHVLVETKGSDTEGRADRLLRGLGLQAMPVSKYGIAVALLYPQMTANPWHGTLHRYFHTRTTRPRDTPASE